VSERFHYWTTVMSFCKTGMQATRNYVLRINRLVIITAVFTRFSSH
jgi:hypothetical protein